jgi:hypothetical protein
MGGSTHHGAVASVQHLTGDGAQQRLHHAACCQLVESLDGCVQSLASDITARDHTTRGTQPWLPITRAKPGVYSWAVCWLATVAGTSSREHMEVGAWVAACTVVQ